MNAQGMMATVIWTELTQAMDEDAAAGWVARGLDGRWRAGPATTKIINSQAQMLLGINPTCAGVPDSSCNYLAICGSVCGKCGKVHDRKLCTIQRG